MSKSTMSIFPSAWCGIDVTASPSKFERTVTLSKTDKADAEARVAFLSQKGGNGKTTLAVHIGIASEEFGERVVVIDTDRFDRLVLEVSYAMTSKDAIALSVRRNATASIRTGFSTFKMIQDPLPAAFRVMLRAAVISANPATMGQMGTSRPYARRLRSFAHNDRKRSFSRRLGLKKPPRPTLRTTQLPTRNLFSYAIYRSKRQQRHSLL